MYMKFGSTMRRFIFFFLVQLHLFSIAGQSAEHRSHAGFDLAIQQLKSEENAIRLDWYPPNIKFSKYELELINRADNSTRIMDVGMGTSFDLRNLHKGTKYEFKIRALDAEGQIIAESAVEKITLGEFFPIKSELLDYAPVQPSVKLTMNSLNSSNFPYIYSSVKLDMKGLENTRFDTTSFAAFEDGRLQKEYFHITLPDSFDGVRLVDFVLIIDNSSSMEDEHQDVLQNIDMFLDSLSSKAVNFRLGLVRFGQLQNWHEPILVNNGILTADPDTLKTWLGTMTADGGVEPGLRAITQAAIGMNFRPGSARHFLLITDEDSDAGDLQEAIDACNSRGIIVHAAVDPLSGNSYSDYCDPEFSIRVTGGLLFPVLGPYSQILNELQNYISNTFIIRYQTDNPVIDGVQREVIIRFTAHEYTSQDTGYYVPGAAPKIVRTPETKALSDSSLLAGSSVEIAAHITDYIAPYVSVATLNYRRLGESEYRSIALFNVYDSLYSANLPGEVVQSNAIEYYITASDGYIISSDPAFDPADHPYQIAIFPNFPPAIIHNSVDSAMVGFDINIHCEAFDTTNYLTSVQLNFRKTGTLLYNAVDMTHTNQIAYAAKIPVPFVTFDGVDYFLSATDDMGITSTHGTKDEPHQIYVYQNPDPPVRIVIEAEEMQNRFHGTPCDSGWILTHQDYPIYEVTHFGIHTFWRFTIIARADIGNNIAPWLKVKLDTVFVGTCEIASTQWKPYTFVAQVPTGDHRLDLQYLNDWWNVDDDRNLLLDKIIIEPIQSSGSRMQYVFEAENMVSYAPGRQVDDCWKFDSGGLMVHQLFLERQSYPVSIIARGDSSEGSWPRITVYVDGRPIAMAAIDSPVLKEYQFQLTVIVPGDHYLSIYYSNHVWRQALYIDKVIFYVNDGGLLKPEPDIKHENDATNLLPQTMTLAQNYPNPFNSGTVIKYQIPRRTVVMLKIYNYIGQELITLADGERAPGYYSIFWNGTNENQMKLPSGIYFYKLVTEETCITRKMLLLQ